MWIPNPTNHITREMFPVQMLEPDETERDLIDSRALTGEALEGICPVCGIRALFTQFNDNLRESGVCSVCSSTNRNRQLGSLVRRRYAIPHLRRFVFSASF